MTFTNYILFSRSLGKYYVGYTSMLIEDRLTKHNSNHKGFTGKANDWKIVFEQHFENKNEALALEISIKKRGVKRFMDAQF